MAAPTPTIVDAETSRATPPLGLGAVAREGGEEPAALPSAEAPAGAPAGLLSGDEAAALESEAGAAAETTLARAIKTKARTTSWRAIFVS